MPFRALLLAAAFSAHALLAQFAQQGAKLVGSGVEGSIHQGSSVAVSADGNTAIVGGSWDSAGTGAVWVYTRSGGVWTQQGSKLVGTGAAGRASQGGAVALSADGNTAIVGGVDDDAARAGTGAVWIYTRKGGVWTQQGSKLVGTNAGWRSRQGTSVSLSADGSTAIVGAAGDNGWAGAAWVYTRSGGVWTQQGGKLVGTGAVRAALQGVSVSLSGDGNTAIVGGYWDDREAGAVWIYSRSGGVWRQRGGKLVGSGAAGRARQGTSVSLSADGNTAIVGGPYDDGGASAVWVYAPSGSVSTEQDPRVAARVELDDVSMRSGGVWTQQGSKLVGTGAVGFASQGTAVSLSADGNTAIVGGDSDDGWAGAAWVYTRNGDVWAQQASKLAGTGAVGWAGQGISASLAADGNTAIVGGYGDDGFVGAAWVFGTPSAPIELTSFAVD